jgi:hypothetical protein
MKSSAEMPAPIDESEWPLVIVRWEGSISDATLNAFVLQMDVWLRAGERFALLIDSRGARGLSPEQRTRLIGHMKRQAELTAEFLVQAIVLDNLMQRTLFWGINLVFPNPFPSKVFAEPSAARAWLLARLAASPVATDG